MTGVCLQTLHWGSWRSQPSKTNTGLVIKLNYDFDLNMQFSKVFIFSTETETLSRVPVQS